MTLKQARVGVDMSQEKMALKLGVHTNTYRRWELKPETMPMGFVKKFCEVVGEPESNLFFEDKLN